MFATQSFANFSLVSACDIKASFGVQLSKLLLLILHNVHQFLLINPIRLCILSQVSFQDTVYIVLSLSSQFDHKRICTVYGIFSTSVSIQSDPWFSFYFAIGNQILHSSHAVHSITLPFMLCSQMFYTDFSLVNIDSRSKSFPL